MHSLEQKDPWVSIAHCAVRTVPSSSMSNISSFSYICTVPRAHRARHLLLPPPPNPQQPRLRPHRAPPPPPPPPPPSATHLPPAQTPPLQPSQSPPPQHSWPRPAAGPDPPTRAGYGGQPAAWAPWSWGCCTDQWSWPEGGGRRGGRGSRVNGFGLIGEGCDQSQWSQYRCEQGRLGAARKCSAPHSSR